MAQAQKNFGSLLRLRSVIRPYGPIPVSRSTWWAGVKSGRYPPPIKLGPGITAWRASDIKQLMETGHWSPTSGNRSTTV